VQDPQVQHLGLMVPVENPHAAKQSVRPAVQFDGQRATGVHPAPLINEHGAAIRTQLAGSTAWPER
jgi:crotonobetainyl-CoA:carnitine CoA-transferase CaiB-like acyl-CoA transferase